LSKPPIAAAKSKHTSSDAKRIVRPASQDALFQGPYPRHSSDARQRIRISASPSLDFDSVRVAEYEAEIDQADKQEWDGIVADFSDADISQTWAYGAARWGESGTSRIVLRHHGDVVAAAQVALVKVPAIEAGMAYVVWGPMWQSRNREADTEDFRMMIRALREQYSEKRGLRLRLMPRRPDTDEALLSVFEAEGLRERTTDSDAHTFLLDLAPSVEDLRAGLKRKWRRDLKRSEKHGLTVTEHTGAEAIETFLGVYDSMRRRKSFDDHSDIKLLGSIQEGLPESMQLKVVACRHEGEPVAAIVLWDVPEVAVALFGATTRQGLDLGASYFLNWNTLCRVKASGHVAYDLGGAGDPHVNYFKSGLAGKHGEIVRFIGKHEAGGSILSRLTVRFGESARSKLQAILG
jgi:peptidoglycan pentaglycine glycine transferase (the first glycine)